MPLLLMVLIYLKQYDDKFALHKLEVSDDLLELRRHRINEYEYGGGFGGLGVWEESFKCVRVGWNKLLIKSPILI